MNFFFVIGGMKDRENPAFGGLFQNFHRLLQTSIHSRSIVLVQVVALNESDARSYRQLIQNALAAEAKGYG